MQSSISPTHKSGQTVLGNAEALKAGTITPEAMGAPIRVWRDEAGNIWTLDHRRLAAYRLADQRSVPVQWASHETVQREAWKFTTEVEGRSIFMTRENITIR